MCLHAELIELNKQVHAAFTQCDLRTYLQHYSNQPQFLTSDYSLVYSTEGLANLFEQKIQDGYRNPTSNMNYAQMDDDLAYAIGDTTFEIEGKGLKLFNWLKVFERGSSGSWIIKSVFSIDSRLTNSENFPNLFELYSVYESH